MIAKTTDGLIGANVAMNEIRTPMRVFKEARAKSDQATMDRAMGYVEKLNTDAMENKAQTDEALQQEAKENRAKAEQQREELAQRIRESHREAEEKLQNSDGALELTAESVSEETSGDVGENTAEMLPLHSETAEAAPVTYTKSGDVKPAEVQITFSAKV